MKIASNEQVVSASQIDKAIVQVTDITQMNSATSQQCAASSEELANLANGLNNVVDYFQLKQW